jgi:apolipoprotein N-acyltransferase
VRAVNTGVSAFVDATGRVYAHGRAVGSEAAPGADRLLEEVALLEGGRTVYARLGDLWAWCCAAVSLVSVLRRDASSKEGARPVK